MYVIHTIAKTNNHTLKTKDKPMKLLKHFYQSTSRLRKVSGIDMQTQQITEDNIKKEIISLQLTSFDYHRTLASLWHEVGAEKIIKAFIEHTNNYSKNNPLILKNNTIKPTKKIKMAELIEQFASGKISQVDFNQQAIDLL
jgi:hypothetical protein